MADVFTVLSKDHEEVKGMLAELEKGPTKATGATEDQLADKAIGQEQEGKKVLARLDKLGVDDPGFETLLGEFIKAGREHIAFEETQVWPALRAALSEEESLALGDKLEQGKKTAPTRPHPHTPASPGVLKTAGPAAAAADRARDAATGRGRA